VSSDGEGSTSGIEDVDSSWSVWVLVWSGCSLLQGDLADVFQHPILTPFRRRLWLAWEEGVVG